MEERLVMGGVYAGPRIREARQRGRCRRFRPRGEPAAGDVAYGAGDNGDAVTARDQVARQFEVPRAARLLEGCKGLMNDEDVHAQERLVAKPPPATALAGQSELGREGEAVGGLHLQSQ